MPMSDKTYLQPEVRKRSVSIAGHRTSLSLEQPFWDELKRLASLEGLSVNALIERIDGDRDARPLAARPAGNLSSRLRIFVLERLREAARNSDLPG